MLVCRKLGNYSFLEKKLPFLPLWTQDVKGVVLNYFPQIKKFDLKEYEQYATKQKTTAAFDSAGRPAE